MDGDSENKFSGREKMASIETLSEDVLLNVFGYLDGKSLKNAALVCKFWNDTISGSSTVTRSFTLNLSDDTKWITKFDEIMSLERRFQSISVTLHSTSQPYVNEMWTDNAIDLLLQITRKHGSSVRKLVLKQGEFENPNSFSSILSSMPLVHELTVIRVGVLVEDDFINKNPTMLGELNKLTVHTCNWNIFKFFVTPPVKELQISNKFTFVDDRQRLAYMNFLEASTKLESIEFDFASYGKTFRTQMDSKICLNLKRLKYWSFSPAYEIDDIDRNFALFLESQASTLTELDLNYVSSDIIKIIFTKLKQLEKLRLNAVVLPTDNAFYGSFRQMPHLKQLTLHDDIPSEVPVKEILVNCCNLETLTAQHDPGHHIPNILTFMTVNTPMIQSLSLDALPVQISPEATFKNLKFLHIQSCTHLENVIEFLDNNVSVETLSLNLPSGTMADDGILDALLNQPNLLHLIVAATQSALTGIYNKIKVNYKKLKSLELRPVTSAANNVFIKFPNDQSEWQPNEYVF